ncbi:MAG: glycosidase [Caulobacteraceae bacterium]|nr:glycosidase [Caulobacteraceae bacterium]
MSVYETDRLVFVPDDVDLSRSPLVDLPAETFVLGAFNPGFTRLENGNLLMMVRVAQALRHPIDGETIRSIRWHAGGYWLDAWPLDQVETSDPRTFTRLGAQWKTLALTSLSWLLPVELSPDGLNVVAVHYDKAITPRADHQCYGIEDPRISRVEGRYYMTTCSVSPERHSTTLYTSADGLDWAYQGIVLDHQNKDMLIFEGLIDGRFWAQTRPLGDVYFAYPPGSPWLAGPSINLAASPDALYWKPINEPGLRPRADSPASARMGGGSPPVRTDQGWLALWHGVEPSGLVGIYRTYFALLDLDDPSRVLRRSDPIPLLSPNPTLTAPLADQMYLHDVVFTTGLVEHGDHYIVASGEADLACRITHVPKSAISA